jgi:hypothetical protein
MHILEQYAVNCGAKIDKPYICQEFFPLPFNGRYICLHAGSGMESKNYDFYDEVTELINPFLLKEEIKIIQVGGDKEKPIRNCWGALGTSKRQIAYIVSNSELYFGNDTMSMHFASYFQKKIVCASTVLFESCFYPYWSDKKDYKIINSDRGNAKPSFSSNENPKTINFIKPEQIAISILDFLKIKHNLGNYKTIHLGKNYYNNVIHFIPDHVAKPNQNIKFLNIRMDVVFDEQILSEQLNLVESVITTNKPISENLLKYYRNKIININYIIDEDNDPNFIKLIKSLNIKYNLLSRLEDHKLNSYKLNYMDFGNIHSINFDISDIEKTISESGRKNLLYKSNHFILSKGQIYLSEYDYFYGKNPIKSFKDNTSEFKSINILKEDPSRFIIFSIDN